MKRLDWCKELDNKKQQKLRQRLKDQIVSGKLNLKGEDVNEIPPSLIGDSYSISSELWEHNRAAKARGEFYYFGKGVNLVGYNGCKAYSQVIRRAVCMSQKP